MYKLKSDKVWPWEQISFKSYCKDFFGKSSWCIDGFLLTNITDQTLRLCTNVK